MMNPDGVLTFWQVFGLVCIALFTGYAGGFAKGFIAGLDHKEGTRR